MNFIPGIRLQIDESSTKKQNLVNTHKAVDGYRRRSMTEEMLLNSIAFKIQQSGDQRLLSGSTYDSLYAMIDDLKIKRMINGQ